MADATAAINTPQRLTKYDQVDQFAAETSAVIWQGTGVAIGSDGKVVHASQSGALYTLGVAQESIASTAPAGTIVTTHEGIFRMANDASHLLTIANRLGPCYWSDDQTVGTNSAKLLAGVVYDVDASGVWVIMGPCLVTAVATGALLAANNLSDVADAATAVTNLGLNKVRQSVYMPALLGSGANAQYVAAPCTGTLTKIYATTNAALTTGNGTITSSIGGVAVTNGAVTLTQAASAAGSTFSATPSAANAVTEGTSIIKLLVGGTQAATTDGTVVLEYTLPAS
jgi:hypothetical protein